MDKWGKTKGGQAYKKKSGNRITGLKQTKLQRKQVSMRKKTHKHIGFQKLSKRIQNNSNVSKESANRIVGAIKKKQINKYGGRLVTIKGKKHIIPAIDRKEQANKARRTGRDDSKISNSRVCPKCKGKGEYEFTNQLTGDTQMQGCGRCQTSGVLN